MSGWMVPKTEIAWTRQSGVCRTCLRPCRFEDEPEKHRGDSKRNRADPHSNQYVPHSYPRRLYNGNARPPTRGGRKHVDCGKNRSDRPAAVGLPPPR